MSNAKHILLAVTGGIAAYKSCELVRLLKKSGHQVTVAMSRSACEFIHPNTFQALSGNPVLVDTHGAADGNGMAHIQLTRAADVMLIAPATANTIAKIANGIADNLITNLAAARTCPLLIAPAMNVEMWHNPANRRNIEQLQNDGISVLMPASGEQACGEVGIGRMLEAAQIADLLPDAWSGKPLFGMNVMITTGATFEAIDPVRGITNISSGQMGVALARACRRAGANVSLIYGQLQTALPEGMAYSVFAPSADAMYAAVHERVREQDVFIAVAAIADYKVKNASSEKIKKQAGSTPVIELTENPDILASVTALDDAPFCVGFAAESQDLLNLARQKRARKNVPLLVANLVADAMGLFSNRVTLLDDAAETELPPMDKAEVAAAIVARIADLLP